MQLVASASSASFLGSGISDLRAVVFAQQKHVDSLVTKVAALLSAMHSELVRDLHGEAARDMAAVAGRVDEEVARVGAVLEGRFVDSQAKQLEWLQVEADKFRDGLQREVEELQRQALGGRREEAELLRGELRDLADGVAGELQGAQDGLWAEVRNLQAGIGEELQQLQRRVARLEADGDLAAETRPALQQSVEHCCDALRDELERKFTGDTEPLHQRLSSLEDFLYAQGDKVDATAVAVKRLAGRLGRVETGCRDADAAAQRLADEAGQLRQALAGAGEAEARAAAWQRQLEERLEPLAAAESRCAQLEDWRRRAEPRLERLPGKVEALGGQLAELQERSDAALAAAQREARRLGQRVEELAGRPEASSLSPGARGSQRLYDVERFATRLDGAEEALRQLQRQLAEELAERRAGARAAAPRPDLASRLEAGLAQVQGHVQQLSDELWSSFAAHKTKAQSASERLVEELRQELKSRVAELGDASKRAVEEVRKDLSSHDEHTRKQVEELRRELEARLQLAAAAAARLGEEARREAELQGERAASAAKKATEDLGRVRDLDAKVSQLQSSLQQLPTQLHQEVDGLVTKRAASTVQLLRHEQDARLETKLSQHNSKLQAMSQRDILELRQELSSLRSAHDNIRAHAEESRRQLGELKAELFESTSLALSSRGAADSAFEAARESAAEAVAALGQRLEDSLRDRLTRCDAAAAGCERCARAVEERLRMLTDDLRRQLMEDGADLIEQAALEAEATPRSPLAQSPPSRSFARLAVPDAGDGTLPFQPKSPSGLLAALSGKVAMQESNLERLRRENQALRSSASRDSRTT